MPATKLDLDPPKGTTRRRFLQGTAAAVGAGAVLPAWLADAAAAATSPLAGDEGMVVVVTLCGGNDALNTLAPLTGTVRSLYESLRGTLGISASTLLPLDAALGLNPKLPKLAARFRRGEVSMVQGVGLPNPNLSHFESLPAVMAGSALPDRSTGWLGRFLDGTPNWDSGYAGVTVANGPRLHLTGSRAKVPALPSTLAVWGTSTTNWDVCAQQAVRELAGAPSGLGPAADAVTQVNVQALDAATTIGPLYGAGLPAASLSRDLVLAARTLNAGIGTRAVAVEMGGWDTHALQTTNHPKLLTQLDDAVEAFWATLSPALANRVCMVVVSEFGRRPAANLSLGTDHGAAGLAMVIGANVRGGFTGEMPSLTKLDANGNLISTVDFRSVYASVLSTWLKADDHELLGATYEQLDLFAAGPGAARSS